MSENVFWVTCWAIVGSTSIGIGILFHINSVATTELRTRLSPEQLCAQRPMDTIYCYEMLKKKP